MLWPSVFDVSISLINLTIGSVRFILELQYHLILWNATFELERRTMKNFLKALRLMDHYEMIIYILIGTVICSATTFLLIYIFLAPFLPAILVHIIYIAWHVLLIPIVRKGHIKLAKYSIMVTFFVQLTLAAFFWFPLDTNYGLFYYLVPIASFALMDVMKKGERRFAIILSVVSAILYFAALFHDLNFSIYEPTKLAIRVISSFSIISTIAPASYIFYLYAVNLGEKQSELEYLAHTDTLTKIANRRLFFELGNREYDLAQKYNYQFNLFILDIDHFKDVNDTYGHDIGDKVLVEFTNRIRDGIRREDIFARIGGEEFAIILRRTTKEEGRSIAPKLRALIAEKPFHIDGHDITVTVSIGVTECHRHCDAFDDMLIKTDAALYKAKEDGRNRVEYALRGE